MQTQQEQREIYGGEVRTVHPDAAQKHPRSYLGSFRCCRHIFPGIAFVTRFTGHLRYEEGNKQNRSKRECAARLQTSEINWKVASQPGQWRLHVFFSQCMPSHIRKEEGKGQVDEGTRLSATAPDIASITNL
jgi:hypothetical protein